ncbi:hypothetical protein THH46_04820 [Pseudomonas sp. NA13]
MSELEDQFSVTRIEVAVSIDVTFDLDLVVPSIVLRGRKIRRKLEFLSGIKLDHHFFLPSPSKSSNDMRISLAAMVTPLSLKNDWGIATDGTRA